MNKINKNSFLILGLIVVLFLCYKFAISNTLELRREYKRLADQEKLANTDSKQLPILLRKNMHYDSILNKMNLGNTSVENNLLRIINLHAEKEGVKVMDFNEPHIATGDNNTLSTIEFFLEGGFSQQLKIIYAIEQKNSFGDIIHVNFQKKRNYSKKRTQLTSRILIQQVSY